MSHKEAAELQNEVRICLKFSKLPISTLFYSTNSSLLYNLNSTFSSALLVSFAGNCQQIEHRRDTQAISSAFIPYSFMDYFVILPYSMAMLFSLAPFSYIPTSIGPGKYTKSILSPAFPLSFIFQAITSMI